MYIYIYIYIDIVPDVPDTSGESKNNIVLILFNSQCTKAQFHNFYKGKQNLAKVCTCTLNAIHTYTHIMYTHTHITYSVQEPTDTC